MKGDPERFAATLTMARHMGKGLKKGAKSTGKKAKPPQGKKKAATRKAMPATGY